ncbi:MAG: hypothetical protein FRX48_06178 [Lasallia pustulata]|uniref:Borealin N-terminal domain-containing protein n=1 Tax=Lasallia pustulata TaxID=136370 RepID=A0A5M8PJL3_9LECA|nr:MAG: hypothetical protein FRX48_06178 [Lasallia pustulata]
MVATKSPARTPIASPARKNLNITQGQKQALIDNLQLEITERARKLRAQYALQAQSLRTRLELRVNRIPMSLRKANMGELLAKYVESARQGQEAISRNSTAKAVKSTKSKAAAGNVPPVKATTQEQKITAAANPIRGVKRSSDEMFNVDQENAPNPAEPIPNPKKRTKGTATATSSRQVTNPSTVLSPKSSNSRTLPHSPIRPPFGSPQKSYLARPISLLKPASPVKLASPAKDTGAAVSPVLLVNEKPKPTRGKAAPVRKTTNPPAATKMAVTRSKRAAPTIQEPPATRSVSNTSNTSNTSTGTTVVKKGGRAASSTAAKKSVAASVAGKKVAPGAKIEAPAAGRRVLRNRP